MEKKTNEKYSEFVCARYIPKELDITLVKSNLKKFDPKSTYNMSYKSIHYPIFQYEKIKLDPAQQKNPPYAQCFSTAFNDDASLLACGYSNGHINIFDINSKKDPIRFAVGEYPVTSLKWNNKKRTTLLIGAADGYVSHWHVSSGKILNSIKEIGNSINSVDFSADYKKFVTAGNDITVRLYDENMKSLITTMKPANFTQPGHAGRIFCVRFAPFDNNVIYSGGWDKTVQFYDIRAGKVINSIFGPEIVGESIDMNSYTMATGAWSQENQIQLWDYRELKLICNVKWDTGKTYHPTYIHAVKFNTRKDQKLLCVGAGNGGLFRVYDMDNFKVDVGESEDNQPKVLFGNDDKYKDVFCCDWSGVGGKKELLAVGTDDGSARIYTIDG